MKKKRYTAYSIIDQQDKAKEPSPCTIPQKKEIRTDISIQNEAISLKIDGKIDLGPQWNFEYNFAHASNEETTKKHALRSNILSSDNGNIIISMDFPTSKKPKRHKKKKSTPKPEINIQIDTNSAETHQTKQNESKKESKPLQNVEETTTKSTKPTKHTKLKTNLIKKGIIRTTSDLYDEPHRVGEDIRVKKFILHLYKRALNYFNTIKDRINNSKKVNDMLRSYKNRFSEFINETQNVRVKTRLGTQKVILNTLEMSNRMLRRIVNYIVANTEDKTILRQGQDSIDSVLNKGLEREIIQEYKYLCVHYGVCRSGYGFTDFLADIINSLLVVNDKELKRTVDSLTEAAKNLDLSPVLDKHANKKFMRDIGEVELWPISSLRAKLMTLKNVLVAKNQPLLITAGMNPMDLNRTLAFLEVLNILHEVVPTNKINAEEWKDLRHSVRDYTRSYRHDIQEIMEALVDHIYKRALLKLKWKDAANLSNNIKIMLT